MMFLVWHKKGKFFGWIKVYKPGVVFQCVYQELMEINASGVCVFLTGVWRGWKNKKTFFFLMIFSLHFQFKELHNHTHKCTPLDSILRGIFSHFSSLSPLLSLSSSFLLTGASSLSNDRESLIWISSCGRNTKYWYGASHTCTVTCKTFEWIHFVQHLLQCE